MIRFFGGLSVTEFPQKRSYTLDDYTTDFLNLSLEG